ncbi:MAG: Crp/Fnr family transcriptional regulator [Candidatus Eisenbacteria bacterium]|nr:Crp/Fnr family transcriptional regulator [Candidatus Eisenbacteria bacterium]
MKKSPARPCSLCGTRKGGCLTALSTSAFERLEGDVATHLFRRGDVLFHAGTPAHSLYVLRSGQAKVYLTGSDGEERVVRLLGPGEMLGYRPLCAGETYGASASAVTDAEVCIIPWPVLRETLRQEPELALELLAKLARELRISEELMMDLVCRPVRQRAARLLLGLLHTRQDAPEPATILAAELKRKDMARMIGTTPETFSRVLRAFALRGIVGLARDRITVRNRALLRRAAGEADPA